MEQHTDLNIAVTPSMNSKEDGFLVSSRGMQNNKHENTTHMVHVVISFVRDKNAPPKDDMQYKKGTVASVTQVQLSRFHRRSGIGIMLCT